jgi:type I pantothenate kinase
VEAGPLTPLVERVLGARTAGATVVVGLAGSVAVGKSTLARALAGALAPQAVEVVGTDGFLFPNAVLIERDLFLRKGFPESYDETALLEFLAAVRSGDATASVPVYSHAVYDVVDERRVVGAPDVCILEGVNALRFADALDVAVYLHAEEEHVIGWYADRFVLECVAARDDETSFYRSWAALSEGEQRVLAEQFWFGINHPNLVEHIAPTATRADAVVVKGPDHAILDIEWRA